MASIGVILAEDIFAQEHIEALREGARVEIDTLLQFGVALWPVSEVAQDQCGPFGTDNCHGACDTAGAWLDLRTHSLHSIAKKQKRRLEATRKECTSCAGTRSRCDYPAPRPTDRFIAGSSRPQR